uniref:3-hydroxy-3-methylglutaryl coenzyme A reductase n=1 Tax=Florenciella parvula TaxID=236787 RepID=A0A7S2FDH1_9STRA
MAASTDAAMCAKEGLPPAPAAAAASGGAKPDYVHMSDEEVAEAVKAGALKDHALEKALGDCERAVAVRRRLVEERVGSLDGLPYEGYCYDQINGANCEIVIGYVQIPTGLVGPLTLDNEPVYIPMATTEGCLVASTQRGAKAISEGGGAASVVVKDGITRAPAMLLPTAMAAAQLKLWVEDETNWAAIQEAFNSTTNFGKIKSVSVAVAGRNAFMRVACFSGDAMGMNMISKGCLKVMDLLYEQFPEMRLISISGNYCADKKPAAVNWIEGRGKSVVVEAVIPSAVVKKTLKTSVPALVDVAMRKNLVGSAMAGSVGGNNAHAANIVAAVFLATGQDPAQVIESSNCITLLEAIDSDGEGGPDLHISCSMPSIEVGTVGGGTSLPAQAQCLDIMGVRGASRAPKNPGDNAQKLGRMVAAAVMAGELSLLSALAANELVKAHMQHNRKPQPAASAPAAAASQPPPPPPGATP